MDKKQIFNEHILTTEVLIVDKNPSSRTRLLKLMYDMGCSRTNLYSVASIAEAEVIIQHKNIGIVLSDYFIGGGSGFDLFKMIRKSRPEDRKLTLILVTSNISQTAVAKAAEENVDSFIIKPYTIQSIQENLISTIAAKVRPSPYILKIEEGKALIAEKKFDEAKQVLEEAKALHTKPALALFYIGQADYLQQAIKNAEGSYGTGLTFNNIHYKCLIGLYELFVEQRKYNQAYQVVKKIAKFFPANPDRIAEVIHLAIRTQNFEDLQMYYDIFITLDERNEKMKNYMGAGLYVGGKHYLMKDEVNEALKYFDQVVVSFSEYTKFTRAIIKVLSDNKKLDAAEKYMSRFPAGYTDHRDYLISEYLILSHREQNKSRVVKYGLELYNKDIRDAQCLSIMVAAMEKCNYNKEMITKFKSELTSMEAEAVIAI